MPRRATCSSTLGQEDDSVRNPSEQQHHTLWHNFFHAFRPLATSRYHSRLRLGCLLDSGTLLAEPIH